MSNPLFAIKLRSPHRSLSALVGLAVGLVLSVAQAERPSAPHLLPENTLALLQVPDAQDLVAKFRTASLGRMLQDEQIRPLASQLYGTVADAFGTIQDQVGMPLDKILAIPQGEVCLALVPPPAGPPSLVMLLDAGDQIASVQQLLTRAGEELEKRGATKSSTAMGDTLLVEWKPANNQPSVFYAVKDGVLLVTGSRDTAQSILAVWSGTAAQDFVPLAENRKFTAIMSRCGGAAMERPQIVFFVDPIQLFRVVSRGNFAAQTGLAILPAIGLDGVQGVGGSLILGSADFDMIQHLHVLLDNPRNGVLKALTLHSGNSSPEPWVPGEVASYMTFHWDFSATYREVSQLVDSFQSEGTTAGMLKRRVGEPLGVDFEEELLAALDGRVTYLTWFERPSRLNSQAQLVAFQLKDAAAFRTTFDRVTSKFESALEKDAFGGQTFHRIKVPAEANQRRGPAAEMPLRQPEPCFALLGDYFVITDAVSLLKQCIVAQSDPDKSLSSALDFKLIASKISRQAGGGAPGMVMFNRPEEGMRMLYDLAQGAEVRRMLAAQGQNNAFFRSVDQVVRDNPLPPFAVIARYLAPGGGMVTSDETGFHYTAFGLRRN